MKRGEPSYKAHEGVDIKCEKDGEHREGKDKLRTIALLCLTSFFRKRNWRFRFDKSIVSRSKSVICPNPTRTMFFTVAFEL